MLTNRREALKRMAFIIGAACAPPAIKNRAAAQAARHTHNSETAAAVAEVAEYAPLFFDRHQYKTITLLSELIIPRTDTPGATDAEVNRYIDLMVSENKELQKAYRSGLAWLDAKCDELFGAPFIECRSDQQQAILTIISSRNNRSLDDLVGVEFFKLIKDMTLQGYYTSKIGLHEELEYKGNGYLEEYPGCQHTEHVK